jgi:phenylacetate-CoA ligase
MSKLLWLYHHLPAGPARSLAATLRGTYLRAWRYGPETERLVGEALAREGWRPEQWQSWQEERLARLLHRAATRVPYYREQWAARRQRGDRAAWDLLANWPVLPKRAVREHPDAFLAEDRRPWSMFVEHTSGTTGSPLQLRWSLSTVRQWYALFEARCRRWHGVSRSTRWAILGGQLVAPASQRRPPFWVWNAGLNQLYLSVYHLSADLTPYYIEALARYRVRYIVGYTSALEALARAMPSGTAARGSLQVAITNAEPVLRHQRETISAGLGCPVRETYGMAEAVAAASECEAGQLHLWPEAGWLEVFGSIGGGAGDLVCTGLLNQDMPLVRYQVGDRAALHPDTGPCACGRTLPRLAYVEGRTDDVLYTRDGRSVGRLDPIFKAAVPIQEAQIVQETLDRVRVRLVPGPSYQAAHGRAIAEELRMRMGTVEVLLEEVAAIPRTANGKFQAVVSLLPPDQRQKLGST